MNSSNDMAALQQEVEKLLQEIASTRDVVKKLNELKLNLQAEISKLREEKSRLLEKIRALKAELSKLREEHKQVVSELKRVVGERREVLNELRALKELISEKWVEWQKLSKEARLPLSVLKKKIDQIEWEIQTTALTVEKEAELVEKLRAYKSLYEKALSASKSREEALELRALRESLKVKVKELTEKIGQLKRDVEAKNRSIERIKGELNTLLSRYMELKKRVQQLRKQLEDCNNEITIQISKLNALKLKHSEVTRRLEQLRREQIYMAKREKISQEVHQRPKKRLTIDELKIMYGVLDEE